VMIATLAVRLITANGTVVDFLAFDESVGRGISSSIIDLRLRGTGLVGGAEEVAGALELGGSYGIVGDSGLGLLLLGS
jgi:hypothetical protein